MASRPKAIARIDLKATPEVRDHIDRGAAAANKSRTEFMLEAALIAADEAMMSKTSFPLEAAAWDEFNRLLDEHDWANDPGFKALMERTPGWQ